MGRIKAFGKFCGKWGWWLLGVANLVVGFAGVPGDLDTWSRWIDAVMNDPLVLELATQAAEIAAVINQVWFRSLLVIIGIVILGWWWRPFWRLRHRLFLKWRRAVSEKVWISHEKAIEVIRESQWGRLQKPTVVRNVSFFDSVATLGGSREQVVSGMSETQKAGLKFGIFFQKTLDSFCEANPVACRQREDGVREIEEVALNSFLQRAIDEEVRSEFGSPPD